jgi:metal-responsive CopG/Arc/MetJ family transcriptional regulator
MSADAEATELVKLDVKVTRAQKQEIDRVWRERGYPSRSEFVRDALRDATEPTLTPDALEALAAGLADVQAGRTTSLAEAKEELGIADDE